MIKTLADQYLAQNAGRRYPFKDDTELPVWLPDSGVLDFRCTVQGVPAGTAVEARLVKAEHTADKQALFTVALTAGGVLLDELVFGVPENAAGGAPYTAYASGIRSHGALTVTSAAVPPGGGAGLPYDAEIEYLESTGTQYIETGIIPDADTGMKMVADSPINTADVYIAGLRNTNENTRWCIGWSRNSQWYGGYVTTSGASGVHDEPVEVTLNFGNTKTFTVGGDYSYNLPTLGFEPAYNIRLFGSAGVVASYTSASVKIRSAQISQDTSIVRDYIPVRFTNELGQPEGAMYDRVSGALHRNQGTGEFVRGDDLPAVVHTLDIPFAATTVVCDSLKVHSIQSAHDLADAMDEDDPAGLDATAAVDGEITLAEGRNAEPYLDGNRLRIDVFKSAGLGERCQSAVSGSQRCGTVLFTINGERPGSDGDIRIVGDGGITVVPDPENHAVEIRMDDEAGHRMADGCAPACPTYTTEETNDTEEAE